ncbi:pyrroline-5-carboxylate reductase [Flagellatimonas centrodinii]|uniref:pyrroline-5-carboxylate reductase n=1 Tax=Flagellatimonas centrodinii TaxID=2806210 RepID=UPI001FEF91A3|nr:pyrroline-5-carboxylate reductase [Flagellatimonas centrodinii]ULQ45514.1 pyrroline-5-carboxylate reductase [Flagellatimonas centrodinii]
MSNALSPDLPIAFIGGGNMAAALVAGLVRAGHRPQSLTVVEPVAERRALLRERYDISTSEHAAGLQADVLVLAVKPQQMAAALASLQPADGTLVLSIAAGVPVAALTRRLPGCAIVRSMPNTPALVGAGISALYAPASVGTEARERADRLLSTAGTCVWVDDEAQLDAVTALSGSGPAYFFRFTEAMTAAGVALGLPDDIAATLARQTLVGAARLVAENDASVGTLRSQVTSKGGTTEAALRAFDQGGLEALVGTAMHAARDRGAELGADIRIQLEDKV